MHLPAPETPEWAKPRMFYGKPLTFNPKTHRYTWDGKHVPSVTTILRRLDKPGLVQWAANCAVDHIGKNFNPETWHKATFDPAEEGHATACFEEVLEEARKAHATIRDTAGDVGTLVHELAKFILSGGEFSMRGGLTPEAGRALDAFSKWREQHRIKPIDLERRVFSADLMYAGTTDFYGYIDDELSVLDFKTGNGVYDEAWFQLAGYECALQEELNIPGALIHWVVHLNKTTGECAAYRRSVTETTAACEVWLKLVALDKAMRAMPAMPKTQYLATNRPSVERGQ